MKLQIDQSKKILVIAPSRYIAACALGTKGVFSYKFITKSAQLRKYEPKNLCVILFAGWMCMNDQWRDLYRELEQLETEGATIYWTGLPS